MKKFIFVILLCASTSFGATRYYLPSSGAAAVNPAINADWGSDNRITAAAVALVSAKTNTALTDQADAGAPAFTGKEIFGQYVSAPIGVVNFNTTTVSLVVRAAQSTGGTVSLRVNIRLRHSDATFATILTAADFDTTVSATASTRIISATSLLNVTSINGDRIVVEIGLDANPAPSVSDRLRFGDVSATSDFALTSGLTTDLDPWVEFSAAIPAGTATGTGNFFQLFGWLRLNFGRFAKL